jgi:hypothetical protein
MSGNGQGPHHVHEVASMLDAALHYAQVVRVPVFPCNCDDKRPLTAHGFHDATRDDTQIRAWWSRFPDAMIAIPCGEVSGVWVLDIDVDPITGINGFPLWSQLIAQHGEIPKTLTSITPRGGRHLFFQWQPGLTIKSTQGVPGNGIDVRSNGGYVILPPSIRADGSSYRWDSYAGVAPAPAPAWLIALCSPRKESTGRSKAARKSPKRDQAWAQAALDAECAKIAATPRGQRNAALNLGAYNIFQIFYGNPGLLDEQAVRERLFKAAETNGSVADDGADSAWRTIDSGAIGAQSQPRVRPAARMDMLMPANPISGGLARRPALRLVLLPLVSLALPLQPPLLLPRLGESFNLPRAIGTTRSMKLKRPFYVPIGTTSISVAGYSSVRFWNGSRPRTAAQQSDGVLAKSRCRICSRCLKEPACSRSTTNAQKLG